MKLTRKEIMKMVMEDPKYSGPTDYLKAGEALQNLIDIGYIEGNETDGYEVTPRGMIAMVQNKPDYMDEEVSK